MSVLMCERNKEILSEKDQRMINEKKLEDLLICIEAIEEKTKKPIQELLRGDQPTNVKLK